MRILIVDDDFLVRSNLKRLIETSPLCRQQGFSVACEATDGEQAMQMIPSARPDLVISDIRMPQMDRAGIAGGAQVRLSGYSAGHAQRI